MGERQPPIRFSSGIEGRRPAGLDGGEPACIGILKGEGIGPEVISATADVLEAVAETTGRELALSHGPSNSGPAAVEEAVEFCREIAPARGAVLAGPHGGRWVYALRERLDLFCKISPLRPAPELGDIGAPITPRTLEQVDVLVVREQSEGVYQGRWSEADLPGSGSVAEHSFSYSAGRVRRIVDVAAALAARRRGELAVVVKDGGVPSISRLWRAEAEPVARGHGVRCEVIEIDYAAYRLIRDPGSLDVVVTPNLFGDILSDVGGALLGSRGLTYGGNFDGGSIAVYQTNHGAAHDLAGSDRANPVGQILSAAMMLRESFGLDAESVLIEEAIALAWREGARTVDLAERGCRIVGTREMGERVADAVRALGGAKLSAAPAGAQ